MIRALSAAILMTVFAITVNGQSTTVTTTTKTKGEGKKQTITYRGCVQPETDTASYVLNNLVPVKRTTTIETPAGLESVTTFELVPGPTVEFQRYTGHQVEVTGVLIPAGDSETKITTKSEGKHSDTKTVETRKTKGGMPQFNVISIKQLAESCS
jgi:hypothetical protein